MGKQHKPKAKAAKKGSSAAAAAPPPPAEERQERHKAKGKGGRRAKKDVHHFDDGDDLARELAAVGLRIKQIEVRRPRPRQPGAARAALARAAPRHAIACLPLLPCSPGRWQLLLPLGGGPAGGAGHVQQGQGSRCMLGTATCRGGGASAAALPPRPLSRASTP